MHILAQQVQVPASVLIWYLHANIAIVFSVLGLTSGHVMGPGTFVNRKALGANCIDSPGARPIMGWFIPQFSDSGTIILCLNWLV